MCMCAHTHVSISRLSVEFPLCIDVYVCTHTCVHHLSMKFPLCTNAYVCVCTHMYPSIICLLVQGIRFMRCFLLFLFPWYSFLAKLYSIVCGLYAFAHLNRDTCAVCASKNMFIHSVNFFFFNINFDQGCARPWDVEIWGAEHISSFQSFFRQLPWTQAASSEPSLCCDMMLLPVGLCISWVSAISEYRCYVWPQHEAPSLLRSGSALAVCKLLQRASCWLWGPRL